MSERVSLPTAADIMITIRKILDEEMRTATRS